MKIIKIDDLLRCLHNVKKGTLREPFPGEEPDFIQAHDKLSTGMVICGKDGNGFSVEFNPPFQLMAGCGYVFEEYPHEG